jgi:hypothetical protein
MTALPRVRVARAFVFLGERMSMRKLSPERIAQTCQVIRDAIAGRQPLVGLYKDLVVTFCPHALGQRLDGPAVLAFLITAEPMLVVEPVRSPQRWRWLRVADLEALTVARAPWWSAPRHTRPPLADGSIEVEAA